MGYSPLDAESDVTEATSTHTHSHYDRFSLLHTEHTHTLTCVTDLLCTPETNSTWSVNYTPRKTQKTKNHSNSPRVSVSIK